MRLIEGCAALLVFSIFVAEPALASGSASIMEFDSPNLSAGRTVPGTTLVYFGKVDDGVYKGSRPRTDADYKFLQEQHIKYIIDLEFLPALRQSEEKKAKRYGILLLHEHINASPVPPSEKHIERVMALLEDRSFHPVYFHCAFGRDRTSLVAALYNLYFLGMSQQDALRYMDESGYKNGWVRHGLKRYLQKHPSLRGSNRTGEDDHR